MAIQQAAQVAIESLFGGAAVFAVAVIDHAWRTALPKIARLRAELAIGDSLVETRTSVRTVHVSKVPARTAEVRVLRPAVRLPAWDELRAAA
ncbi:MAG: hypothetical protein ACKOW1_05725 [Novosphingobium sp.]